jgi:glutamate racemase
MATPSWSSSLRTEGPIGVFDSGLGGLSVLRALTERMPREDFVYLGDTARTPYGTRGKQTILNYTHACARALREHRIKLLVVACNTVSAIALEPLAAELFIPAVGAILPGLHAATKVSVGQRIGVLASSRTALSGSYEQAFPSIALRGAQIFVQPSPLLIALADEGWLEGEVPRLAVREYLTPLLKHGIDTLLLGCSQFPLLSGLIERELAALGGGLIRVVSSAEPLADECLKVVTARQLATVRTDPGKVRILLTDLPEDLRVAERYLGAHIGVTSITAVDL